MQSDMHDFVSKKYGFIYINAINILILPFPGSYMQFNLFQHDQSCLVYKLPKRNTIKSQLDDIFFAAFVITKIRPHTFTVK